LRTRPYSSRRRLSISSTGWARLPRRPDESFFRFPGGPAMPAKRKTRAREAIVTRVNGRELPLRNHAERALSDYFTSLNGHRPAADGVAVREVASYTGFPEIMGGRLKTLHPKIHGGLLGRRGMDDGVMAQHGIAPIDLLAVNLYPFAATVARPGSRYAEAIENIDVGGPAMLRAAAKNHESVLVVVDPADYPALLAELAAHQGGSAP